MEDQVDRTECAFCGERAAQPVLVSSDVDAALDELLFAGGRLNAALLGALGGLAEDGEPSEAR